MASEEGVRLQKVLSQAGIASRRVAERMILDGRVEVDGQIVVELGTRVHPGRQTIRVDGTRVLVDEDLVTRLVLARMAAQTYLRGQQVWITANNKAEGCAPLSLLKLAEEIAKLVA